MLICVRRSRASGCQEGCESLSIEFSRLLLANSFPKKLIFEEDCHRAYAAQRAQQHETRIDLTTKEQVILSVTCKILVLEPKAVVFQESK